MTAFPMITLNDDNKIPQIGLGLWQVPNESATATIHEAWNVGYRLIDTAAIYRNEEGVGEAIASTQISRKELFITTKLWNDSHGYDKTMRAFEESLKRLKLDYIDLYLIHWPVAAQNLYVDSWKALIQLQKDGHAKSIGVSNFNIPHLERIIQETGIIPEVNQIELHPQLPQKELREFHTEHGIATESWSPLARGALMTNNVIQQLAQKYRKTPAQIILRWHIELGLIVIPKSITPSRIEENFHIFDFHLDTKDMAKIETLNIGKRIGPDPDLFA